MIIKFFCSRKKEKYVGCLVMNVFLIAFFLLGCTVKDSNVNEEVSQKVSATEKEENTIHGEENVDYVQLSKTLNWDELQDVLFSISTEELLIGNADIQSVSSETLDMEYDGTFPDDLIKELGEILLQNSEIANQSMAENDAYFELLKKYGSDEYTIIPEDENDICLSSFQYDMNGKEYILNIYDSKGSAGYCYAVLSESVDGEMIMVASFDMQNEGRGQVICYEEDYYFVYLFYNYNLKYYDSIYLYRLGPNAAEDNLCIRCIPQEYIWDCKLALTEYDENEIDNYIDQIKGELMSGYYIEVGKDISCLRVVDDDSEVVESFPLSDDDQEYYKVDFANIGVPIYYRTTIFTPSNYDLTVHLEGEFYLYDGEKRKEIELLELETNTKSENQLVQMWFHEIDNRVYTFQVYHLSGYNYLLSVRYIEGNDMTIVRQELIIPKFGFEIKEGQKWIAF